MSKLIRFEKLKHHRMWRAILFIYGKEQTFTVLRLRKHIEHLTKMGIECDEEKRILLELTLRDRPHFRTPGTIQKTCRVCDLEFYDRLDNGPFCSDVCKKIFFDYRGVIFDIPKNRFTNHWHFWAEFANSDRRKVGGLNHVYLNSI